MRNLRALLFAQILLLSVPAFAGTRMVFPRIVFKKGLLSGLAVSNPTGSQVNLTFTAYNLDGTKFSGAGVTNPGSLPKPLPAGGQNAVLASQVFNVPDTIVNGTTPTFLWVEATSDTDGLTGFYLEFDTAITYQYGGDLGTFGTDLYLPAVENTGTTVTEISVVNADTSSSGAAANLTVDFLKSDGTKVDSKNVVIQKAGAIQGPLSGISGFNVSYDQVVALRIRSDRPVLCYGLVRPQSGKTPVALPAEDVTTPAKTLYFPQLVEGNGWTTGIGVANLDFTSQAVVNIFAYKPDGTLYVDSGITNPISKQIPPGGFLRAAFKDLFPFSDTSYKDGWIQVDAASPAINGFVEYGTGNNRAFVIAQLNSYKVSIFSHQAQAAPYWTGLAVLNPGSLAANVEIFSLDKDGGTLGRTQTVLRPGQRTSQLLFQIVNESANYTYGSIFVRSNLPVIATELFAKNDGTALVNVPPQKVTTSFSPQSGTPISPVPPLAVVEIGKSQQFTAGGSGIQWSVVGGGTDIGSVSASGLYTAPSAAPQPHSVAIQAKVGNNSGASSIDVVKRDQFATGLSTITSVAYLSSERRLFVAEQQALSGAPSGAVAAASVNTNISEVLPNQTKTPFLSVPNDTIAKMLPLTAGGVDYMILAGHDSGTIYRLDVAGKKLATVATGLNQPNSLALDPITGNLLVAESGAGKITVISSSQILSAPIAGALRAAIVDTPWVAAITATGIQGIATDKCSGTVYATLADGTLHAYQGSLDQTIATGLVHPGQMVALYRDGFDCGNALTLTVVEASQISLIYPKSGEPKTTMINTSSTPVIDITYFPKDNPFAPGSEASLVWASPSYGSTQGQIAGAGVGGLYESTPPVAVSIGNGVGPNQDPVGDTFDDGIAAELGYSVPDIISVDGAVQGSSSVITIKFAGPVTLGGFPTGNTLPPDQVWAFIFMKTTTSQTVQLPEEIGNLGQYFPFTDTSGLVFDSWAGVFYGQAYYVSWNNLSAGLAQVSAVGNTLTFTVPSSGLNLSGAQAIVIVGNPDEFTDVAPNNGVLKLAP